MKKTISLLLVVMALLMHQTLFSQIYYNGEAQKKISEASSIAYKKGNDLPIFIKLESGKEIDFGNWQTWLSARLKLSADMGFVLQNVQHDQSGDLHYRYNQTYLGNPILGKTFIVHTKNNKVYSFNGDIISSLDIGSTSSISEEAALLFALANINATLYKWQMPGEEALLKEITDDPEATYYPKGELYIVTEGGDLKSQNYRLAYRFDVYASKPLKRAYVFVDAITGEIILSLDRIQTTDTPGTAITKYSGTQTIITDSYNSSYRLREVGRGNGIETYNMATSIDYATAVDFTDADNNWNNVNAAQDEVATDAHYGAEMTYDYYKNKFNRNSIDNNGFKLISYVHYDVAYANAYWDGTSMTYGDGDATYSPLTTLDICGHEITHGLDEKTANLIYLDESGALNEGYSDIFGTCIEKYARPSNANWLMGSDIGTPFRDMSNPNAYNQPDTYLGTNWDAQQEVHTNSGVLSYWFYLTSQGGSGTNDNGDAYNITGITMDSAAAVAFRTMTVYLPSGATYADARFYSILSAMDLFGACTPEVETVTDAWYAVGVGDPYNPIVTSDFTANYTTFCSAPATVQFTNLSSNSNIFHWDFGDGTTSSAMSPSHTYSSYGNYTISLISDGGACGKDTLIKTTYISVDTTNACIINMLETGTADTQTSCDGQLFDSGGNSNYQDYTNSEITIAPAGAMNVTLHFVTFNFENNYDYLTIYDGPSTSSTMIGSYTGATLPNGGTIVSTTGSITLVQTSDEALNESGFELNWQCNYSTVPPVTNFKANETSSCTGTIDFTDLSTNGPANWFWSFGDGGTSIQQNPTYTYLANGVYTVKLRVGNSFGLDSMSKVAYITINKPPDPIGNPAIRCDSGSVTLTASGGTTLNWYDSPLGGNLVYTGNIFETPTLGISTTFYVQNETSQPSQYIGPVDNTFGGGSYFTSATYHYEIFDCYTPVILKSVKVFANSSGNRTIELTNSAGTVLLDTNVNIPSGQSTVILNFNLPVGTGLRLGVDGGNDLFRNNAGASYPYTLNGIVSITGNSAGLAGYYYYFYNWEMGASTCSSNRVPVTASILLPNAQITPNGNIVICNGQNVTLTAQTADSYLWSPGNQTTQSITVNATGSYSVQITHDSCTAESLPVVVTATSNLPVADFGYFDNDPTVNFADSSLYGISYLWKFGDGQTSTQQNPSHTYATNGTYIVTLIVSNPCGSDTIVMPVDISMAGLALFNKGNVISIYPNPSKGLFNLDIQTSDNSDINYIIYDIIGNTIKTGTIQVSGNQAKMMINLNEGSKGIYLLRLMNSSMNYSKRIIID